MDTQPMRPLKLALWVLAALLASGLVALLFLTVGLAVAALLVAGAAGLILFRLLFRILSWPFRARKSHLTPTRRFQP